TEVTIRSIRIGAQAAKASDTYAKQRTASRPRILMCSSRRSVAVRRRKENAACSYLRVALRPPGEEIVRGRTPSTMCQLGAGDTVRTAKGDGMKLPDRVTICEVGPRDGFQIEPEFIPTEQKVDVVDLLAESGLERIEVTSFVHPKAVPQTRDAEQVMAKIRRRPGTRYAALVPNDKGAVRAVDAGVDAIHTVVS